MSNVNVFEFLVVTVLSVSHLVALIRVFKICLAKLRDSYLDWIFGYSTILIMNLVVILG